MSKTGWNIRKPIFIMPYLAELKECRTTQNRRQQCVYVKGREAFWIRKIAILIQVSNISQNLHLEIW